MQLLNNIMQIMHYVEEMDISVFNDLERLSQTGNFTEAAKQGNISQPAFSRRIKALENWVGATLVDRSRQPVKLTRAGSQMLEAGLQSLAYIERGRRQIQAMRSELDDYVVTFGEQHSISWRFYTNWLRTVENTYGPILSRLRADDISHCMKELKNGDVDFVIAYAHAGESINDDQSIVIGKDRLVPVCKPRSDGNPIFKFDENGERLPYLRLADAAPISQHLEQLFQQYNLGASLNCVYEDSIAGALLIRTREGGGVAWLPESLIEADLASETLVRTGSDAWMVELDIRLHRNKQFSNRMTQSIWAFLEKQSSNPPSQA